MAAATLKRPRAARHARGRARRRARSDRARGVARGAPTRRISVVSAAWFSSVLSYLSRALLMPSSALLSSSLSIAFPVSLGRSSLVLAACCRWVIRHHLRGRGEEASFIVPAACFLVSYCAIIVRSPHATERPPFRHFRSHFRCLGWCSCMIFVARRWVIRHHLRGRGEESSFIIPAACFSSVLSYSSCAVPMPST